VADHVLEDRPVVDRPPRPQAAGAVEVEDLVEIEIIALAIGDRRHRIVSSERLRS
jgi:hypothetical protein